MKKRKKRKIVRKIKEEDIKDIRRKKKNKRKIKEILV
jgi:hypothetical protein